jgi:hypothetical protein
MCRCSGASTMSLMSATSVGVSWLGRFSGTRSGPPNHRPPWTRGSIDGIAQVPGGRYARSRRAGGMLCTRDGAQNAGLGGTFGEPLASEGEARRSEHRQENSDHGRKDAHSAIKLRDGVDQLLPVLVERFDGDDRALPSSSPGGNSRARDPDVLGRASGAGHDDLGAKAVVVCVACPRRGRGGVYHRQSFTLHGSPGQPKPQ